MRISKPDISIPSPNISEAVKNSTIWRFKLFIAAAIVGIAGITFTFAGVVLIAMMAVETSVMGVLGASLMLAVGIVLLLADYLWLTI